MAFPPVRTTSLSNRQPLADDILVNRNKSTALQSISDLSRQLAGSGPLATAIQGAAQGLVRSATRGGLAGGTRVGQPGEVTAGPDRGSYSWSGSAWIKVGDLIDPEAIGERFLPIEEGVSRFNLWDPEAAVDGYLINPSTGLLQASANYVASGYMPVTAGAQYRLSLARYIAFYDQGRSYVSGTHPDSNVPTTVTIPAGVSYMRCSTITTVVTAEQMMVVKGTTLPAFYMPHNRLVDGARLWLKSVPGDAIEDGAVEPRSVSFLKPSKNLFNKSAATPGYYVDHQNNVAANAQYAMSDFIPVTPGQQYYGRGATLGMRFTCFYNAAKVYVAGGYGGAGTSQTSLISVPANVYFVRFTSWLADLDSFQFEQGSVQTAFEPWGHAFDQAFGIRIGNVASRWTGKAWAALGDSITANGNWQNYLVSALGLMHANFGIGGTRISGANGDANAMCQATRINAIPTTIDLLTLLGGTNDWAQNVAMGTIDSADPLTFYGALNTFATRAMSRWPAKRILLVTTPYGEYTATYADRGWSAPAVNGQGLTTRDYAAAIRAIGLKWGLPVVDFSGEAGWNALNIASFVNNESGNFIHPNAAGAQRMAEVLLGRLKALEPVS